MIQLGRLATSASDKEFPDNWKAIARMTRLDFEIDESNTKITIFLDNMHEITIHKDNHVAIDAPLTNKLITALIIESVKASKNLNKMGDLSNV